MMAEYSRHLVEATWIIIFARWKKSQIQLNIQLWIKNLNLEKNVHAKWILDHNSTPPRAGGKITTEKIYTNFWSKFAPRLAGILSF